MAKIDFFRALLNSAIFTALAVIPQIFFSATAAYAFARLKFPGRNLLFLPIHRSDDDSLAPSCLFRTLFLIQATWAG